MPNTNLKVPATGRPVVPPRNIQIQIDRALAYGRKEARLSLDELLRTLHLPAFRECYEEIARMASAEELSYEQFLWHLCDRECLERFNNRTQRFLREARQKVWANATALNRARRHGPDAYGRVLAQLEELSAAKVRALQAPGQVVLKLAATGFGVRLPAAH